MKWKSWKPKPLCFVFILLGFLGTPFLHAISAGYINETSVIKDSDTLFPPSNVRVDALTLKITWEKPRCVWLDEDFESFNLAGSGWQMVAQGTGWNFGNNGGSNAFKIPATSTYAYVNDHAAGSQNNGCCDFLITPVCNLTFAENFTLSFRSFFTGDGGQTADIQISTDNGQNWTVLRSLNPGITWQYLNVDLSEYSGANGLDHVRFAFCTSDNGTQATGWAIDDVKLVSEYLTPDYYNVKENGNLLASTQVLDYTLNPALHPFGDTTAISVSAVFNGNESVNIERQLVSQFLYPPRGLMAVVNNSAVILTWQAPLEGDCSIEKSKQDHDIFPQHSQAVSVLGADFLKNANSSNLLSYSIYRDGQFLTILSPFDLEYWDTSLPGQGTYCYQISANYNLTPYGFPGETGESVKTEKACAYLYYCACIPMFEDWTTGQFEVNLWTPGPNWVIDGDAGNPAPAAKFRNQPNLINYSSSLKSWEHNASIINTITPYKIICEFDLFLADQAGNGTELLTYETGCNGNWDSITSFTNNGSFGWTHVKLDITRYVRQKIFRSRFTAQGANTQNISYWLMDNYSVYVEYDFMPPFDLTADWKGVSDDRIELNWQAPVLIKNRYILDDGTAEQNLNFYGSAEVWVGNKYEYKMSGKLEAVQVNMESAGGNATYTVEVFDSNRQFVAASQPFVPSSLNWTWITMPDVLINDDVYVMLRMNVNTFSDKVMLDTNGSYATHNPEWYFDGIEWRKLSNYGFAPGVIMMRLEFEIADDKAGGELVEIAKNRKYTGRRYSINDSPGVAENEDNKQKSAQGLNGFNIYRMVLDLLTNDTLVPWEKIGSVIPASYSDANPPESAICYYYVTSTYDEGESQPSNIAVDTVYYTSLQDRGEVILKIWPNPADSKIEVYCTRGIQSVTIATLDGRRIESINAGFTNQLLISLNKYRPAAYMLTLTDGNLRTTAKIFQVIR